MPHLPWCRLQLSRAGQAAISDSKGAIAARAAVVRVRMEREKCSATGAAASWAVGLQSDKQRQSAAIGSSSQSPEKRAAMNPLQVATAGVEVEGLCNERGGETSRR